MKKHHWHAFWYEKLFKKHPQPHCQTYSKCLLFRSQACGQVEAAVANARRKSEKKGRPPVGSINFIYIKLDINAFLIFFKVINIF
jgi:hypothetical protein